MGKSLVLYHDLLILIFDYFISGLAHILCILSFTLLLLGIISVYMNFILDGKLS